MDHPAGEESTRATGAPGESQKTAAKYADNRTFPERRHCRTDAWPHRQSSHSANDRSPSRRRHRRFGWYEAEAQGKDYTRWISVSSD
jgi:hypothetical protein